MPLYDYRCNNPSCRQPVESTFRGDQHPEPCPTCHLGVLKRKFSVNMAPVMQEHFNHTLNKPVSSMSQFRRELRDAGDQYTERTGIPVNYEPREWGEMGATEAGMDNVNKERVDRGMPALKLP